MFTSVDLSGDSADSSLENVKILLDLVAINSALCFPKGEECFGIDDHAKV